MANIGAATRVNREHDVDCVLAFDRHRIGRHGRKGVAKSRELIHNRLRHLVDAFGVVDFARFKHDQRFDLVVKTQHVTAQRDVVDGVLLAFGHVDRDEDVGLIGSHGNLDAVDFEVEVALILVEASQRFQVSRELFTRVEVALSVETGPLVFGKLHLIGQFIRIKHRVAHEADLLDGRGSAFVNVDRDADAVAFQRRSRGLDINAVVALREVLTAQFLIGTFQNRVVENSAFSKTDVTQTLFHTILVESLDAVRFNGCDSRTFDHVHHQHRSVDRKINVAEQAGRIKLMNGFSTAFGVVFVAYAKRQMRKDRTGLGTLNALDANVGNGENLCGCSRGQKSRNRPCQGCFDERTRHELRVNLCCQCMHKTVRG